MSLKTTRRHLAAKDAAKQRFLNHAMLTHLRAILTPDRLHILRQHEDCQPLAADLTQLATDIGSVPRETLS